MNILIIKSSWYNFYANFILGLKEKKKKKKKNKERIIKMKFNVEEFVEFGQQGQNISVLKGF